MTVSTDFHVGLACSTYDVMGHTYRIRDYAANVVQAEELGFDSAWISDHFWTDMHAPAGRHGQQDPFVALAHTAALTSRITLGIVTVCAAFRPVGQLARQALSLSDACSGRLIMGMGAGWNDAEYKAFGYPKDHRASRLEEQMKVLPALLRNEPVSFDGAYVHLEEAQLRHTAPPPALWVGATSPRMLEITARYADGWNIAWFGPDTSIFKARLEDLRRAQDKIDRDPAEVEITVGLRVMPVDRAEREWDVIAAEKLKPIGPDGPPDWWASPIDRETITGTDEQVADAILAYRDAGATHVILTLSPTPFIDWNSEFVERVARLLPVLRA